MEKIHELTGLDALKLIISTYEPEWGGQILTKSEYDKFIDVWRAFEGPVKDHNHFQVKAYIGDGYYAIATYDHGGVEIQVEEEKLDKKEEKCTQSTETTP